jgi:hypothetical protein
MSNDGYLNDPKVEFGVSPTHASYNVYSAENVGTLKTTNYALGIFVLSIVIFFTMGMYSSAMWVVSMVIGILASLVAIKGTFDSKGSVRAIIVAIITTFPALGSGLFLLLALFAHANRAVS